MYFSIFTMIEVTLNLRLRWLIGAAISQISSISSTILRLAPPGMQPPSVIQFNASNVPVYLGDVARVSDSFAVQNNMVHVNGKRAAYLAILKHADASTLAVVDTVSIRLLFIVGTDFFPTVDAGLMKLHLRAPPGNPHRTNRTACRSGGKAHSGSDPHGGNPDRQRHGWMWTNSVPLSPPPSSSLLQADTLPPPPEVAQIPAQTLADVAAVTHRVSMESINHYTVQRILNVDANLEGRDLGSVSRDIEKKIAELGKLPAGMRITLRGQNEVMFDSFKSLGFGLILAIVLVYFLMVVLFQPWTDPFIVMTSVPGALVGIVWMLALTGTTINVESLMGSIMAVGIATSNSILLVSFANDSRVEKGGSAAEGL